MSVVSKQASGARVGPAPLFGHIDHVGMAVDDLEAGLALYGTAFRMRERHRERVEALEVEAVMLEVGESHLELLCPLSPDSVVGRFLERNGPGLHHVAYQTQNIDSALVAVRAAGLRLIDQEPRAGVANSRIAFLDPRATGGVLTELVEPAR